MATTVNQQLRFLRYYVIQNKRDPNRSSLLIEWSVRGLETPVQQWCELGTGHLDRNGKPIKLGLNGHFRVKTGTQLAQWFKDNDIAVKKLSEAHSGFRKQLNDPNSVWFGDVYETDQESTSKTGGKEIQRKNRTKMCSVKRKPKPIF